MTKTEYPASLYSFPMLKKLFFITLFLFIPILTLSQDLPDEDWLCITQNPFQVSSDIETFEITETPNYIFNPSEGIREYDSAKVDATTCRENTKSASFICRSTIFPDVELLFHMNTVSKKFNYVKSIMSDRGGNSIVTLLGTCSKL